MTYEAFLRSKMELAPASGFEAKPEELNPVLKPHQRDSVLWALRGGGAPCSRALAWERRCSSWSSAGWP